MKSKPDLKTLIQKKKASPNVHHNGNRMFKRSGSKPTQTLYLMPSDPGSVRLRKRLPKMGFNVEDWPGRESAQKHIPCLYDFTTELPDLDELEKAHLTVLICRPADHDSALEFKPDLLISDTAQLDTLAERLALCKRERRRQREQTLRQHTQNKIQPFARGRVKAQQKHMLWLGPEAGFLNPFKSQLKEKGIELTAALSAYTAQHYLESHSFDFIGLYPRHIDDDVMHFLDTLLIHKAPRTWQIVLILDQDTNSIVSGPCAASVDLILDTTDDIDRLVDRLSGLTYSMAGAQRARTTNSEQGSTSESALATSDYLAEHIHAQIAESEAQKEDLTLIGLSVEHPEALEGLSALILPLLRESDLAAQLSPTCIAISLPGTDFRGGTHLARRIQSDASMVVRSRVIQRRTYHTAKSILGGLTALTELRRPRKVRMS